MIDLSHAIKAAAVALALPLLSGCVDETLAQCRLKIEPIMLLRQSMPAAPGKMSYADCLARATPQYCRWLTLDENIVLQTCMAGEGYVRQIPTQACLDSSQSYTLPECYKPTWLYDAQVAISKLWSR